MKKLTIQFIFSTLSTLILLSTLSLAFVASLITFIFEVFHLGYNRTRTFFHCIYSYTSPPYPSSDWVVYYTHKLSKGSIQATPFTVVTEDGHQLIIHRLSLSKSTGSPPNKVIYFQHGFFESSLNWIATGERSLAFLFVRQNWDVWLGNNRGNTFTNAPIMNLDVNDHKHVSYGKTGTHSPSEISSVKSLETTPSINSMHSVNEVEPVPSPMIGLICWIISLFPWLSRFIPEMFRYTINSPFVPKTEGWDFYDMAYKDVPCILKYIEDLTNSPIHCVGQSQGAVVLLLAEKMVNEINRYPLDSLYLISAPIVLRKLSSMSFLLRTVITFGLTYTKQALALIHLYIMIMPKPILSSVAHFVSSYILGFYTTSISPQDAAIYYQHTPNGAPCLKHCQFWKSLIESDMEEVSSNCSFGSSKYTNPKHLPNLPIKTRVHFFFGKKDNLVDVDTSIKFINSRLRFKEMKIELWSEWSHIDFGWGSDRYIDFYPYLIYLISKNSMA